MDCPYCGQELKIDNYTLYSYSKTLCCDKDIIVKQQVTYTIHPINVSLPQTGVMRENLIKKS